MRKSAGTISTAASSSALGWVVGAWAAIWSETAPRKSRAMALQMLGRKLTPCELRIVDTLSVSVSRSICGSCALVWSVMYLSLKFEHAFVHTSIWPTRGCIGVGGLAKKASSGDEAFGERESLSLVVDSRHIG